MKASWIIIVTAAFVCVSFSEVGARPAGNPGGDEKDVVYLPFADVMPEPVGGLGAISKHLVYPELARNANVEGKIYLVAYINEKGDVDDVKVLKGLPAGCDEAAIKAIKETKFIPGKQNGNPVKVQLSIPVTFKLR
jgi:protein TonB